MRQVPVALIAGHLIDLHDTDCCHNSSNCKNVKQVETTKCSSTYFQKNKAIRTGEPALVNPIIAGFVKNCRPLQTTFPHCE